MFELALLALGLFAALFLLGVFFKLIVAVLIWPLKAVFWLAAGLLKLILLPFQFIGGIVFAVLVLPLIVLGVVMALGVGVPLLLIFGIALMLWIVGSVLALIGSVFLGWC